MLTQFTNKDNGESSAARSLASLGSAQLAPNGAQKSSQRSSRETPKKCKETTKRVAGKAFESSPERPKEASEKPPKGFKEIIKQFAAKASESTPERPREAPERPLEGPQRSLRVQEKPQRSTRQKAPQLARKKLQRDHQKCPGEVPERHRKGPRRQTQRALERPCFRTSAGHKMYCFP